MAVTFLRETVKTFTNLLGITQRPTDKDDEARGFVTTVSSDRLPIGRLRKHLKDIFKEEFKERDPEIVLVGPRALYK